MTIDDQIRDGKLQYDINREAAKISALPSNKIHKYEYLTGEDILPVNRQQIIEQARFTYSPLGKSFEKQINTIKDQGEKQIEALESLKKKEITSESDDNNTSITKEVYDKILEERMNEILKIRKKIDYDNLIYNFKGNTDPINIAKFEGPIYIYDDMKNGKTTLQQIEKQQKDFKKELNEITSENPKHKSDDQLYIIENIKNLYNSRQKVINLLNDYSKFRSEAIYKGKQNETKGTGLKILTPKQALRRFPIALAQVKAGKNSENLLNKIRQIIYSLCQSKEFTEKLYNNLIKSL